MKTMRIGTVAAGMVLFFGAGAAKAECPAFPQVSWWGLISHETVAANVAEQHRGDWVAYIAAWEQELGRLRDIDGRKGAALVSPDKLRLEGDSLAVYIRNVAARINVARCLAAQGMAANPPEKPLLATFF